uniref:(northern house mosquito) hypothetical protein n=1 Tax=Culex pipiens TaxID=7175 RepID=A0A8D8FZY5_CULPI
MSMFFYSYSRSLLLPCGPQGITPTEPDLRRRRPYPEQGRHPGRLPRAQGNRRGHPEHDRKPAGEILYQSGPVRAGTVDAGQPRAGQSVPGATVWPRHEGVHRAADGRTEHSGAAAEVDSIVRNRVGRTSSNGRGDETDQPTRSTDKNQIPSTEGMIVKSCYQ